MGLVSVTRPLDQIALTSSQTVSSTSSKKMTVWSSIIDNVRCIVLLFLNKQDLFSFGCVARRENRNTLDDRIWAYHRKKDYYQYEWKEFASLTIDKHKSSYLLSHCLEFLIRRKAERKAFTKSEEEYAKRLGLRFPQFGYVVKKLFPEPVSTPSCIDRLSSCITSCWTCCSSPVDVLRAAILNSENATKYGGTFLLSKFLLLIESSNVRLSLNLEQVEQLIRLQVTNVDLFNSGLTIADQESLAITLALQKDFRALENMLNFARTDGEGRRYLALRDKYTKDDDSDLAPILYRLAWVEEIGKAPTPESLARGERLLIKSLKNYRDGNISRAPESAFNNLAYIKFNLGQYEDAHALYIQVLALNPSMITNDLFIIEFACIKMHVGKIKESQGWIDQANEFYNAAWTLYERLNRERILPNHLLDIAQLALCLKKYDEIDKIYSSINKKDMLPTDRTKAALIYSNAGNNQKALDLLNENWREFLSWKSADMYIEEARVHSNRARSDREIYTAVDVDYSLGIQEYRKEKRMVPVNVFIEHAQCKYNLGKYNLGFYEDHYGQADLLFREAIEQSKSDPFVLIEYADFKFNLGKLEEANELLNQAVKYKGDKIPPKILMGYIRIKSLLDRMEEVDLLLDQEIEKYGNRAPSVEILTEHMRIKYKLRRYLGAAKLCEKIIAKYASGDAPVDILIDFLRIRIELSKIGLVKMSLAQDMCKSLTTKYRANASVDLLMNLARINLELEYHLTTYNLCKQAIEKCKATGVDVPAHIKEEAIRIEEAANKAVADHGGQLERLSYT